MKDKIQGFIDDLRALKVEIEAATNLELISSLTNSSVPCDNLDVAFEIDQAIICLKGAKDMIK